jgi:hypothetical protein
MSSMSRDGVYLNVHFAEKDDAKRLGARWDPEARKWYVPAGRDVAAFSRWLPVEGHQGDDEATTAAAEGKQASDDDVIIWAPLYVAEGRAPCWKCGRLTAVYALAASAVEDEGPRRRTEITPLSNVQALPMEIAAFMRQHYPSYRVAYSKRLGRASIRGGRRSEPHPLVREAGMTTRAAG